MSDIYAQGAGSGGGGSAASRSAAGAGGRQVPGAARDRARAAGSNFAENFASRRAAQDARRSRRNR